MEAAREPQPAAGDGHPPAGLRGLGVWNEAPAPDGREAEVARALRRDLRPVARAIAEGLKRRDFAGLKTRLAGILKECGTETAEAMERAMREAGGAAWDAASDKGRVTRDERKEGIAVANDIANPCPKCHRNMPKDGPCTFCAKRAANHQAGKAAYEKIFKDHKDIVGAMERDSIGKIDFIWGKRGTKEKDYEDGEGFDKILFKHKETASALPGVIAYGDIYESKTEPKYYIVKKRYVAVLRKRTGSNHYLITGFKADDANYVAKIREECELVEKGE